MPTGHDLLIHRAHGARCAFKAWPGRLAEQVDQSGSFRHAYPSTWPHFTQQGAHRKLSKLTCSRMPPQLKGVLEVHAWQASRAWTVGRALAASREAVNAASWELAAAMRPRGCIDSDGVRCSAAPGSTSSASGNTGAMSFSSSAHGLAHSCSTACAIVMSRAYNMHYQCM